jgi:hypothetical protein
MWVVRRQHGPIQIKDGCCENPSAALTDRRPLSLTVLEKVARPIDR